MYNELWGRISALLVFVGFNLTFLPQFVLGSRGMPRRYATYDPEFAGLHRMSTHGSMLLGIGLLIALIVLLRSLIRGRRAPANPWGGACIVRSAGRVVLRSAERVVEFDTIAGHVYRLTAGR